MREFDEHRRERFLVCLGWRFLGRFLFHGFSIFGDLLLRPLRAQIPDRGHVVAERGCRKIERVLVIEDQDRDQRQGFFFA